MDGIRLHHVSLLDGIGLLPIDKSTELAAVTVLDAQSSVTCV